MRSVLLAGCVLLALAVPSQAALTITSVDVPAVPIKPEIENLPVAVNVAIDCSPILLRQEDGPMGHVLLTVEWESTPYVVLTGPIRMSLTPQPCLPGASQVLATANFHVAVVRTAPAFEALPITVHASLEEHPLDSAVDAATANVRADAYLLVSATAPVSLKACDCDQIEYEIELINYGNARTVLTFELDRAPEVGSVVLPASMILESPMTGAQPTNGSATVIFDAPAAAWGQAGFTILIHSTAAEGERNQGPTNTANFLARNLNDVERVKAPGAAPLLALLVAVLASLAVRRQR